MTAEELKKAVAAYANEHLPGWKCAGVSFRIGEIEEAQNEMLLILPAISLPASRDPLLQAPTDGTRG